MSEVEKVETPIQEEEQQTTQQVQSSKKKNVYVVKGSKEEEEALKQQEQEGDQPQEEEKENKRGNNRQKRNNNNRRNNDNRRNKSRNQDENREENNNNNNQGDRKNNNRNRRENKYYDFDKTKITLETEVPEMPKESSRPDYKKHNEEILKLSEKIKALSEERAQVIKDTFSNRKQKFTEIRNTKNPLLKQSQDKLEEVKQLREQQKKSQASYDVIQKQVDELEAKKAVLAGKMDIKKFGVSFKNIEEEIARIKYRLGNERLNQKEEQSLLQKQSKLAQALPLVTPLLEIEDDLYDLNNVLFKERKQKSKHYKIYKEAQNELDEIRKQIKEADTVNDDVKSEEIQPVIDGIRADYSKKIDALYDKKKDLQKKFKEAQVQHDKDFETRHYITFVTGIQQKLKERIKAQEERERREKNRKEREEQRIQQLKDEKEERMQRKLEDLPFVDEILNIKSLITVVNLLEKSGASSQAEAENQQQQEIDENEIKGLTLIVSKRNQNVQQKNQKKKTKQQAAPKQEVEPAKQPVNIDYETIQKFSEANVAYPIYRGDLPKALEQLQEKLDYYTQQQDAEQKIKLEKYEKGEMSDSEEEYEKKRQEERRLRREQEQQEGGEGENRRNNNRGKYNNNRNRNGNNRGGNRDGNRGNREYNRDNYNNRNRDNNRRRNRRDDDDEQQFDEEPQQQRQAKRVNKDFNINNQEEFPGVE